MSDEDREPAWIEPDLPGPVATRFGWLRSNLEHFARSEELELRAYEALEPEAEIWVWNMYGRGKTGHFCIQVQTSPADADAKRLTLVLYQWKADTVSARAGEWVPVASWYVDEEQRLWTTIASVRKMADDPLVEAPEPPRLKLV